MSTFLYVKGDDYAAEEFEDHFDIYETCNQMITDGITKKDLRTDCCDIEIEIKEFGEVDDKFIEFVLNNLCDYDELKNCKIYKVK